MNAKAQKTLDNATAEQVEWVLARILTKTDWGACERAGVSPNAMYKWENRADLRDAAEAIRHERAMATLEAYCFQLPEAVRKTTRDMQEQVANHMSMLIPMAIEALKKKLKKGATAPMDAIRLVLDPHIVQTQKNDSVSRMFVEYVNDWRTSAIAESAQGAEGDTEAGEAVQLVECGPALAKNDNGNVHSG